MSHTRDLKKGTKPVSLRDHRQHTKMLLPTVEELEMVETLLMPVVTARPRPVRLARV